MKVCFHDGVISQFEGYEALEELDWEDYRRRYPDMSRLDRILEAEGDTPNRYKLAKQADVTMLFFVLSADELAAILRAARLRVRPRPHPPDDRLLRPADVARLDASAGWSTPGSTPASTARSRGRSSSTSSTSTSTTRPLGTTREGIHLGAMVGSLDLLQRGYAGVETRDEVLRLHPVIPRELRSLAFQVRYRRHLVDIEVTTEHGHRPRRA